MNNEITESHILESREIEKVIYELIYQYDKNKIPIEVSFRSLLPKLKNIDRATHLLHTYPAKLLLHIPYFFLNNEIFSKPGDLVLDPFCGTGTVLLEAILADRNAIGADANPIARLIAKVKTTNYFPKVLINLLHEITYECENFKRPYEIPSVVNLNYWFSESTKNSLMNLLSSIELIDCETNRDFFLVCFSNLIKKVSYADPRVSVPVRLNEKRFVENSDQFNKVKKRIEDLEKINVIEKFQSICIENINRVSKFNQSLTQSNLGINAKIVSNDARKLTVDVGTDTKLPDASVDLIITSPPYAGAQKYIRSSSLSLGWLGLASVKELKLLDRQNIGRESYTRDERNIPTTGISSCDELVQKITKINIVRAKIVSNYIQEMKLALTEATRVLKPNCYFILIVGNNQVCNQEFNTQMYLTEFLVSNGMSLVLKLVDDIKSYGLMTKRNKTANIISREWVLIFKKNEA
jgi:hypothetical protein